MNTRRFDDDATSVVDDSLLAEIRGAAAKRARAGQESGPGRPSDEVAATAQDGDVEPVEAHDLTDDDVPVVEGYGALREIGRGGFSRVYEALQFDFDRWVALKVLNETLDGDEIAEFERECRLMGVLSRHPNIVTILDSAFTEAGLPCISMELFTNGSYLDVIQESGPLGLEELFSVAVSISGALATAHRQGVVHGDVKPQNIFRSEFGAALGDFGIASLINHGLGPAKTRLSLYYAAPEVIQRGAAALSPFSDQYSLAATLYTLATGERPFQASDSDSTRELLIEALTAPIPRLGKDFPAALGDTLHTAMTREPALRYRDMRTFAAAVSEIEAELGYRPTEMRILTGSGRYAAQVPGQSASRDLSQSGDHPPAGPSGAPRSGTATGPRTGPPSRTESRDLSVDYDDATIVRPAAPVSPAPAQAPQADPPASNRRKWMLIGAAVLVLVLAVGVAAVLWGRDSQQADADSGLEAAVSEPTGVEDAELAEAEAAIAAAEAATAAAEAALEDALADDGADPDVVAELEQQLAEAEEALEKAEALEEVIPTPGVPDPLELHISPIEEGLVVAWSEPWDGGSPITGYVLQWEDSAGRIEELKFTATSSAAEIPDLVGGATYRVRVAAENDNDIGGWAEATAVAAIPAPAVPAGLEVWELHRALAVSWGEPPADGPPITEYRVELLSGNSLQDVLNVSPDDRIAQFTELVSGRLYEVRLAAVNRDVPSEPALVQGVPLYRLALVSAHEGREAIYYVDARVYGDAVEAPYGLVGVTDSSADLREGSPGWSPDGSWIAFNRMHPAGTHRRIFATNIATGEERQLMCGSDNGWGPSWSSGGGLIAFARGDGGNDIWTVDIETGEARSMKDLRYADDAFLSWSPDGDAIAFARRDHDPRRSDRYNARNPREIRVLTGVASGATELGVSWLTAGYEAGDYTTPDWSPDGDEIAYSVSLSDSENRQIGVMDRDGGWLRQLTSGHYDNDPSWSPDGRWIAFARGLEGARSIYVIDSAGGEPRRLMGLPGNDYWAPSWAPNSDVAVDPTFDCRS